MEGKFVFLGTGSSTGIPVIGCECEVCQSSDVRNKRMRAGAYLEIGDKKIIIDAGPDIRDQALAYGVKMIDGCIITHPHYDHIAGFDDLKMYKINQGKKLPCLMSKETFQELKNRFSYFFNPIPEDPDCSCFFTFQKLNKDFGTTEFEGIAASYVSFMQAGMKVTGVRFGNMAYISDIKEYDEEIFSWLKGVDFLIVSALNQEGSNMHFSLQEAMNFATTVGAKKTYLTHISHKIDHEAVQKMLPEDVILAYDGLSFSFYMDK